MAEFLYRIQPTRTNMLAAGPTSAEGEIVGRHFSYLQELAERGVVRLVGRTMTVDESAFGIVILQVEDAAQAEKTMLNDPAVAEGVMQAQQFPFRVALG